VEVPVVVVLDRRLCFLRSHVPKNPVGLVFKEQVNGLHSGHKSTMYVSTWGTPRNGRQYELAERAAGIAAGARDVECRARSSSRRIPEGRTFFRNASDLQ
jgi:hypothetical protein